MATAEIRDELKRLAISKDNASTSSVLSNTPTATSVNDIGNVDDEDDDEFDDRCSERWAAALNHCKAGLAPADFELVQQFDSPEKLLAGLEKIRGSLNSPLLKGFQSLVHQVYDMEQSVRPLVVVFILAMMPRPVATGMIWGFMYLVIKLSSEQELAARKIADMFLKLRRQMAILKKRAAMIEKSANSTSQDKSELRRILIDIFQAIILFWQGCVIYFRKFPPGRFKLQDSAGWVGIENSFAETLLKVEDAMEYLRVYVAIDATASSAVHHLRATPRTKSWHDESRLFPMYLLPDSGTTHFLGRDDALSDMDDSLIAKSKDRLAVHVVCGIGGMGKTEVAREYAYRNKVNYDAIFWAGSESQQSLRTQFARIAMELCLPGADLKADPAHNLALVHHWLRVTSRRWLLILDNVEKYIDVEKYLPQIESPGAVIVTTRYLKEAQLFNCRRTVLDKLHVDMSETLFLQLLTARSGGFDRAGEPASGPAKPLPSSERDALRYVLDDVDGLPLGIHQMAALVESQSLQNNLARFADRYKRHHPLLLKKQDGIKGHTLSTLWALSFETVRDHPSAYLLLGLLCLFQPDDIPKDLFLPSDTATLTSDLAFCTDDFELDETVTILKNIGLIEANDHRLRLHRLVQVAFMMHLSAEERQNAVDSASLLLRLALPVKGHGHLYDAWSQCQRFVQHGSALAHWFERLRAAGQAVKAPPAFVGCALTCAWYLIESNNERGATTIFEIALSARMPTADSEEAALLNGLGMAYFGLNELPKSRTYLTKAHAIRVSILERNDLSLAVSYQNMGNIDSAQGLFPSAIRNFELALEIRAANDRDFPASADHGANGGPVPAEEKGRLTATATTYLSKARVHLGAKEYERATSCLEQSRNLIERGQSQHALEHPANYLHGDLHLATGDYDAAIAMYNEAVRQADQNDPGTGLGVSCLYKIGTAHFRLGDRGYCSSNSLSEGLQRARPREDKLGHQARLFRRQAQVVRRVQETQDETVCSEFARSLDVDELMSRADGIRLRLQGTEYRVCDTEDEEESCFENLVGPFYR